MTYQESNDLMSDPVFRGRVKVSCLNYAQTIMIEEPTVTAHNSRMRWAATCYQNPDMVAGQVAPPSTMDPAVQQAGKDVTDAALQGAVQAVVDKMI